MPIFSSKNLVILVSALALTGCGHRYIHSRATNPLIEDRVRMGHTDEKKMSVLTSRADRRTILVFGENAVCAEPSPDVAEAIYQQTAAKLAAEGVNAGFDQTTQTALLQLSRRSQGLDFYRSGSFVNCLMHYNGIFNREEYIAANESLLARALILTTAELDKLPAIYKNVVQVTSPSSSTPDVDSSSGSGAEE